MLVNLKLNNVLYRPTLVNMYVHNNNDDRVQFLNSSCNWIKENAESEDRLIISGDMNCALTELDRPSGKLDKSSQSLKKLLLFTDTVDVWRPLNNETNQYTYIPNDNQRSSSRIDYILTSRYLQRFVTKTDILTAPVPEHRALNCNKGNRKEKADLGFGN